MTTTNQAIAAEAVGEMLDGQRGDYDVSEFERLCRAYLYAKSIVEGAKVPLDRAHGDLQAFIDAHGITPENADKTTRCESARYLADVVRAVATDIKDARVATLQRYCSRTRQSKLFSQLFSHRIEYSLVAGADKVLEELRISPDVRAGITSRYALCFTPRPKSPALKVVDFAAERRKLADKEAAKAAKKATKKKAVR